MWLHFGLIVKLLIQISGDLKILPTQLHIDLQKETSSVDDKHRVHEEQCEERGTEEHGE